MCVIGKIGSRGQLSSRQLQNLPTRWHGNYTHFCWLVYCGPGPGDLDLYFNYPGFTSSISCRCSSDGCEAHFASLNGLRRHQKSHDRGNLLFHPTVAVLSLSHLSLCSYFISPLPPSPSSPPLPPPPPPPLFFSLPPPSSPPPPSQCTSAPAKGVGSISIHGAHFKGTKRLSTDQVLINNSPTQAHRKSPPTKFLLP